MWIIRLKAQLYLPCSDKNTKSTFTPWSVEVYGLDSCKLQNFNSRENKCQSRRKKDLNAWCLCIKLSGPSEDHFCQMRMFCIRSICFFCNKVKSKSITIQIPPSRVGRSMLFSTKPYKSTFCLRKWVDFYQTNFIPVKIWKGFLSSHWPSNLWTQGCNKPTLQRHAPTPSWGIHLVVSPKCLSLVRNVFLLG